jgi:cation transport protein ChaC
MLVLFAHLLPLIFFIFLTPPLSADGEVWGVAFGITAETRDVVLAGLDHREKGGYTRHTVSVECLPPPSQRAARPEDPPAAPPRVLEAIVYVGTHDNPDWAGPAPMEDIAAQIARSVGPSGPNPEYLFNLAAWARSIGRRDPHLEELDARVRELLAKEELQMGGGKA